MNQVISQLNHDLRADWGRDLSSCIRKMSAEHQQCQQATSDNIKETVRTAMEEWFTKNQPKSQLQKKYNALESTQSLTTDSRLMTPDSDDSAQVEQLTRKLEMADVELAGLRNQLKATQLRADQLRSMIIPDNEDFVLDSEIEGLFSEVRATTQYVARRLYTNPDTHEKPTANASKAFFKEIEGFDPERRQDAIHTHLFLLIRRQFFPNKLRESNIGKCFPTLYAKLVRAELQLTEAIRDNWTDGTGKKELANWSRASFDCIDLLEDESDEPDLYAIYLEQFFKPAETDNIRAKTRGRKKLRELCEKAEELGILMRRAADTFQVFIVKDDVPLADYEGVAQELRCNLGRGSVGTKEIDACLFGGLSKISSEYPTETIVLEKAMVSTRFGRST
ncbi:unnamed protein product [Fusarium fujikuroi]|nr:unnamed protein product [Fusarium fujikuroi]